MKIASLGNGPFKRLREASAADSRPKKKPTGTAFDSESESENENENENDIRTNWKNQLGQIFRKRDSNNAHNRKRHWRNNNKHLLVQTSTSTPSSTISITPELTPVKNEPHWQNARIDSVVQLATVSPIYNEEKVTRNLADLKLAVTMSLPSTPTPTVRRAKSLGSIVPHAIFEIPEMVENILGYVNASEEIPREKPYTRRKPLSLEHAKLIYKDERKAIEMWNNRGRVKNGDVRSSSMHNCMMVNRLWFQVGLELLLKKFHFKDLNKFRKFLNSNSRNRLIKPKMMVLHKFHNLEQSELDELSKFLSCEGLKWLEFYICPNVVPPIAWIHDFYNLEKLILPGNKKVDDKFLIQVSSRVNNLKVLDLRACDNITDSGVIAMALKCPSLKACNLGRHRNNANITSLAVVALARHTDLETLGTAGCKITDAGLWELAQLRGPKIKRLSLNNCDLLTNHSIPVLLGFNYFPNLAVLELRNVDQITEVRNLIRFKLWKKSQHIPVLIEGCERITKLMHDEENVIRKTNSFLAFQDMSSWVNAENDTENR